MTRIYTADGVRVLACPADGPAIRAEADALDLIGDAVAERADWVAVPVERFGEEFFRLRTRVAGEFVQKFVNYRLRLAIVGDLSQPIAASTALRDFVAESNRGRQLWFVADLAELDERLSTGGP
jgi:hypothetical protein